MLPNNPATLPDRVTRWGAMTRLLHCSRTPLVALHDIPVPPNAIGMKPPGFWYAVGDAWAEWCRSEQPDWIDNRRWYAVDLGKTRMLRLCTVSAVKRFHRDFSVRGLVSQIAWPAVAVVYDGVEFAPYFDELRFMPQLLWYYSIDCASGVVWNASGVRISEVSAPVERHDADHAGA